MQDFNEFPYVADRFKAVRRETVQVRVGEALIGGNAPILVQSMTTTKPKDVDETVRQTLALAAAGCGLVRITAPTFADAAGLEEVMKRVRAAGCTVPVSADIHFQPKAAFEALKWVEKVRINPGNFHPDHQKAREQFAKLLGVCKEHGTTLRIGLNHGSLGERITNLYGNTPLAMKEAVMEWLHMCREQDFERAVVSLKASNTIVMVEAYRLLAEAMEKEDMHFPLHLGVTEAGNGDSGRIKSCVGISTLLSEGIGNTIRVSLTEDPENELPVARYLADRYDGKLSSTMSKVVIEGRKAIATYAAPSNERLILDAACDWGKRLMDREIDEVKIEGCDPEFAAYLEDELLQACRRKFYRPEYVACPGCGRTMYNLEETFNEVKRRTAHLKGMVIAVMGCIVNGPGEMADADWGYVGEGNHKVSIYKGKTPVLRHVPETEAIDRLLELIENA